MTESKKINLFAWAIFFYLVMTIFHKAFVAIGMLLFIILAFFTTKDSYRAILKDKKIIFYISMVAFFILSLLITGDGRWNKIKYYLPLIPMVAAFYEFGPKLSDKWIKRLLFWFLTLAAISSIVGTLTVITDYNIFKMKVDTSGRNKGAFLGIMYYSYINALICIISTSLLFHFKKFKKYINLKFLIMTLIINLVGLYFTYTRGAILAFIAGLPFIFYYTNKKTFISLLLAGFALLSWVLFLIFGNHDYSFYRFKANSLNESARIVMFKAAAIMYTEKPVTGYGFQNFNKPCIKIQDEYDIKPKFCHYHSHNQYLEMFGTTGTFGGIAFLLFFGSWLLTYLIGYRDIYLFSLPGLVTFLAICMTDTPFYFGAICSIIFTLFAMMFVKERAR